MNKIQHYFDTPIDYLHTDIGYMVTVYGKKIGTVTKAPAGPHHSAWAFNPSGSKEVYYGFSLDMAVLNYFSHVYGGGLDG